MMPLWRPFNTIVNKSNSCNNPWLKDKYAISTHNHDNQYVQKNEILDITFDHSTYDFTRALVEHTHDDVYLNKEDKEIAKNSKLLQSNPVGVFATRDHTHPEYVEKD